MAKRKMRNKTGKNGKTPSRNIRKYLRRTCSVVIQSVRGSSKVSSVRGSAVGQFTSTEL